MLLPVWNCSYWQYKKTRRRLQVVLSLVQEPVLELKMLMGAERATFCKLNERKNLLPPPSRGPEKLKVDCLVVTVQIMFKWYNNVVATNIED